MRINLPVIGPVGASEVQKNKKFSCPHVIQGGIIPALLKVLRSQQLSQFTHAFNSTMLTALTPAFSGSV